jgi:TPR repeat protein
MLYDFEKTMKKATSGDKEAQNTLGWMYLTGKGIKKNDIEAFNWYKKSAEQEYTTAQFNLGKMYTKGHGVERDLKGAEYWYKKAAELNYLPELNSLG